MSKAALRLVAHHTPEELWAAYRQCPEAVGQRHIHLIALVSDGRSKHEVLAITRYSAGTYLRVMERYNAGGLAALLDGRSHNPGRPPLVSATQVQDLAVRVRADYDQGVLWDAHKVKQWLQDTLGCEVHLQRAFELLHQVGFSVQRPRPQHVNADAVIQNHFKKNAS